MPKGKSKWMEIIFWKEKFNSLYNDCRKIFSSLIWIYISWNMSKISEIAMFVCNIAYNSVNYYSYIFYYKKKKKLNVNVLRKLIWSYISYKILTLKIQFFEKYTQLFYKKIKCRIFYLQKNNKQNIL